MKKTAIALLALSLCACGGKSSNGSGSTGTGNGGGGGGGTDGGPAATVTIQVNLVGAGSGRVTSQPAGIDCPGACAMAVAPGTLVTLTATADAKSHFEGYGGGTCSGLACAFTADTTTKPIFANFSPLAPNPVQHTLTVAVAGATGTVVSAPNGITCPGVCSAQFADGTKVALTATSTAGNTVTWSGACTGSADCTLALTADAAVTATFADPCAGLVPALPAFVTATNGVTGPGLTCSNADSDGAGNVYWSSIALGANGTVFANGTKVNGVDARLPLITGFATILAEPVGTVLDHFVAIEPDGSHGADANLPVGVLAVGRGAEGGSVVVVANCVDNTVKNVDWAILYFDDAANPGVTATLAAQECARPTILIDAAGLTFVIYETVAGTGTVPPHHLAARWLDAAGKPVTDWFDAGVAEPAPPSLRMVRPLIGGGVALRFDDQWTTSIRSGKAQLAALPVSFPAAKDVRIVESGKAYLTIPDASTTGTLDVLTPQGKTCGAVTEIKVNLADTQGLLEYYVGKDGTLIGLTGGPSHCTAQYYPHLLK